jgi:hypothetical protein
MCVDIGPLRQRGRNLQQVPCPRGARGRPRSMARPAPVRCDGAIAIGLGSWQRRRPGAAHAPVEINCGGPAARHRASSCGNRRQTRHDGCSTPGDRASGAPRQGLRTDASPPAPRRHFSMIRQFHLADVFTLANAACGVAAIGMAMRALTTQRSADLFVAAAFAPAAFVFDFLDGRVARWRQTSSAPHRRAWSRAGIPVLSAPPTQRRILLYDIHVFM